MSGQSSSTDPTLLADPQDPLPESNWVYRRWLSITIIVFIGWQLHMIGLRIARQADSVNALLNLAHWLIVGWGVTMLFYMIAPSAEQIVKILATLSAWKSGIATSVTSKISSPQGSAETKTVTGPVQQPPTPTPDPALPDYAKP